MACTYVQDTATCVCLCVRALASVIAHAWVGCMVACSLAIARPSHLNAPEIRWDGVASQTI